MFEVNPAGGAENVNARIRSPFQRFGGAVDIGGHAPAQPADDGPAQFAGDLADGFEVIVGGDRKARFDIDPEAFELAGDFHLLGAVEAGAG